MKQEDFEKAILAAINLPFPKDCLLVVGNTYIIKKKRLFNLKGKKLVK